MREKIWLSPVLGFLLAFSCTTVLGNELSTFTTTDSHSKIEQNEQDETIIEELFLPKKAINSCSIYKVESSLSNDALDYWMPDKNVQLAVSKALGIPISELTKQKVSELGTKSEYQQLDIKEASSLIGLEYATGGNSFALNATDGTISDLTPLSNVNMAQLNIKNNNVHSLTPLANKRLNSFIADSNNIVDLSPLNFSRLTQISIDNNHISNISMIPSTVMMVVARNQTIVNPPVQKNNYLVIDTVCSVNNYELLANNFFNISNNGIFYSESKVNTGKISWNDLDSSVDNLSYNFNRQYNFVTDFNKSNKVYFSGEVIQPFLSLAEAGNIIVKYVNQDGEPVSTIASQIIHGNIGDIYDTTTDNYKLDIDGYTLNTDKLPTNSKGIFTEQEQTVTYIYTKDPVAGKNIIAKYQDDKGNQIHSDVVKSGNVDEPYTTDQLKINGYSFKDVQGNPKGSFTDQEQTITYIYTKDPVVGKNVTAKYQDDKGNQIHSDVVKSGNVDEPYTTDQLKINGYSFKDVQGNPKGSFTEQEQTVTYIYKKIELGLPSIPKVTPDQGTNVPSALPTRQVNTPIPSASTATLPQTDAPSEVGTSKAYPATGEKQNNLWVILGIIVLIALGGFYWYKKSTDKKKND